MAIEEIKQVVEDGVLYQVTMKETARTEVTNVTQAANIIAPFIDGYVEDPATLALAIAQDLSDNSLLA